MGKGQVRRRLPSLAPIRAISSAPARRARVDELLREVCDGLPAAEVRLLPEHRFFAPYGTDDPTWVGPTWVGATCTGSVEDLLRLAVSSVRTEYFVWYYDLDAPPDPDDLVEPRLSVIVRAEPRVPALIRPVKGVVPATARRRALAAQILEGTPGIEHMVRASGALGTDGLLDPIHRWLLIEHTDQGTAAWARPFLTMGALLAHVESLEHEAWGFTSFYDLDESTPLPQDVRLTASVEIGGQTYEYREA